MNFERSPTEQRSKRVQNRKSALKEIVTFFVLFICNYDYIKYNCIWLNFLGSLRHAAWFISVIFHTTEGADLFLERKFFTVGI